MLRKKGVTLIESMLAMSLISLAIVGGTQYYAKKLEAEQIDEFIYDYKQIIKGLENKIINDGLYQKEYWRELNFSNANHKEHLKYNLISQNSKCAEAIGHPDMEKSYANCFIKLNTKQFNVNFVGSINFYKNNDFKVYKTTFVPKNKKGLQKIAKLEGALKRVFLGSDFYSDVDYYNKGQNVSYMQCIKEKETCSLRMSFGTKYDYLEDEKELVVAEAIPEWNQHGGSSLLDQDIKEHDGTSKPKESDFFGDLRSGKHRIDTSDGVQDFMAEQGVILDDKEALDMKREIDKLKDDPAFIESVERQLDNHCSQYDEDDYYFMELYEKDNVCYIYKTEGLH